MLDPMKPRLQRPRNPLLRVLPWILAAAAFAGVLWLVRSLPPDRVDVAGALARGTVGTAYVGAVERSWIDDAFPELWLPAPVTELPCPTGVRPTPAGALRISEALAWVGEGRLDDALTELAELDARDPESWTAGLALGMLLAREGRLGEAETVLASLYGRRTVQATVKQAVEAASRNRPGSGPPADEVRGAIHLLHAYGYVLIATHRDGDALWLTLKNPIGCAKLLALRGETDRLRRLPAWDEHRLAAPGCRPGVHGLSTLDLYNNLIVGYLDHPGLRETPERRQREIARDYDDPPRENPLLAVLRGAAADAGTRESWLWAVSNAERLLRQRRVSAVGELRNPRLAYNLAALMESALPASPPAAAAALRRQKNALLELAFEGRGGVLPGQVPELNRALARLRLLEAVRAGAAPALPDEIAADLDDAQRRTVFAVSEALARRADPEGWLRAARSGEGTAWRRASRTDLAAALARRGAEAPRAQRGWWARAAGSVLAGRDEVPAELAELRRELGLRWRISPRRLLASWAAAAVVGGLAGALAWILGTWLAVELGRRRDLFTSFYGHEARRRFREGG